MQKHPRSYAYLLHGLKPHWNQDARAAQSYKVGVRVKCLSKRLEWDGLHWAELYGWVVKRASTTDGQVCQRNRLSVLCWRSFRWGAHYSEPRGNQLDFHRPCGWWQDHQGQRHASCTQEEWVCPKLCRKQQLISSCGGLSNFQVNLRSLLRKWELVPISIQAISLEWVLWVTKPLKSL